MKKARAPKQRPSAATLLTRRYRTAQTAETADTPETPAGRIRVVVGSEHRSDCSRIRIDVPAPADCWRAALDDVDSPGIRGCRLRAPVSNATGDPDLDLFEPDVMDLRGSREGWQEPAAFP